MRHRAIFFVILLVLFALFPRTAGADPARVRVEVSSLRFDGKAPASQFIPLAVEESWTAADVQVLDIEQDGQRSITFGNALQVSLHRGDVPRLEVRLVIPVQLPPGSYRVKLALVATRRGAPNVDAGATTERSEHTLEVVVPAPELDVGPPLLVEIVDPLLRSPTATTSGLVIKETSRRGWAGLVQLRQERSPIQDGRPASGELRFDDAQELLAGGEIRPKVTASGFALGSSTATLTLNVGRLTRSPSIPVEVRHRLHEYWVVPFFALGLFLGWLVRVWTRALVERKAQREQAREVARQLLDLKRNSLPEEEAKIQKVLDALYSDAQSPTADLTGSLTTARECVAQVKAEHTRQLDTQRETLRLYLQALELEHLPKGTREILASLEAEIPGVQAALIQRQVVAAEAYTGKVERTLQKAKEALLADCEAYAAAGQRLKSAEPPLPEQVQRSWGVLIETLEGTPDITSASLQEALQKMDAFFAVLTRHLRAVEDDLDRIVREVREGFTTSPAFVQSIEGAATLSGETPLERLHRLVRVPRALFGALSSVATTDETRALLDKGDIGGLLHKLHEGRILGSEPQVAQADTPQVAPELPGKARQVPDLPAVGAELSWPEPASRKATLFAEIVQVLAPIAIVSIGAWWLYHETFIGKPKEIVSIVATGFLTNISFDTALEWLGRLRKQ